MLRMIFLITVSCIFLSSCAGFKPSEFIESEGQFNNYQKNYSFSLPNGYALLGGENKEYFHKFFSDFAPKDSDYFYNKKDGIILVCFKGETFEIPVSQDKKELFDTMLRSFRFEFKNIFKNHPEITIDSIDNIENFITVNGKSNNAIDDTSIKMKITFYPVSKLSKTNAIFFMAMGIPIEREAKGESDLKHIMSSLELTAFDHSERIVN